MGPETGRDTISMVGRMTTPVETLPSENNGNLFRDGKLMSTQWMCVGEEYRGCSEFLFKPN